MRKNKVAITIFIFLLLASFVAVTLPQTETTTAPQIVQATSVKQPPKRETVQELLALTNAERAKLGVAPLVLDERLNQSSQLKADELEREGWDSEPHVRGDGKRGYSYVTDLAPECYSSENLLFLNDFSWWMASKSHREALQNPRYDLVGFAVTKNFTVQHFCDLQ